MIVPDFFSTDPDWAAYAVKHGFPLPPAKPTDKHSLPRLDAHSWDCKAIREASAETEASWARDHPLSTVGYESTLTNIRVRDGTFCSVKVSWPAKPRHNRRGSSTLAATSCPLPVLFVTHGGGWIQGTHNTEEAWLLRPLYQKFDTIIVSVEYRLAPEHRLPTWIEDSWDVLQQLSQDPGQFLPTDCPVQVDPKTLYLAGSSSGGGISAVLSQLCHNHGVPVSGVILNVPVLCDYRDMSAIKKGETSYDQCIGTFSDSRGLMAVWDMIRPSPGSQPDPLASPLLGDLSGLPPHIICVAGQDPLRDEGIQYARKLQQQGSLVRLQIYPGVPHNFGQFWELKACQRFWDDLQREMEWLLEQTNISWNNGGSVENSKT
jgi:acetyl esterase/lipase